MKLILRIETSTPYLGGICAAEAEVTRTGVAETDNALISAAITSLEATVEGQVAARLAAAGIELDENGNRIVPPEE